MLKKKLESLSFLLFLFICCIFPSCNDKKENKENSVKTASMQSYIDSCSTLYLEAINELKNGSDKKGVQAKYADHIRALHFKLGKSFDSITLAYTSHKITQSEYDKIRQSLFFDSVKRRSEELSQLGVTIELK